MPPFPARRRDVRLRRRSSLLRAARAVEPPELVEGRSVDRDEHVSVDSRDATRSLARGGRSLEIVREQMQPAADGETDVDEGQARSRRQRVRDDFTKAGLTQNPQQTFERAD